jgi:Protein of unknown function (DUF4199)
MEETTRKNAPSVMAVALKFGLIMGLVSIVISVITVVTGGNPLESDWKGWVSILLSIGILVLAHKNFKDSGDGYMSYGQGLGIGFIAFMVSIVIGFIFMMIYMNFVDTGLMEDLMRKTQEKMESQGQNEEAIEMAISWTKKLFWVFYFIGGALIALVVSLIVAAITQKKNPEPFV